MSEYQYREHPVGRDAKLAGYAPLVRTTPLKLSRADRREYVEQLSTFEVFKHCRHEDLTALVAAAHPFSFPPDWAMVTENTPADFCYAITRGTARVYRGREQVAKIGAGSLVGEMAALTGALRSATVTTESRVTGVAIANDTLVGLLHHRPSLYAGLREQFARRAAEAGRVLVPTALPPRRRAWSLGEA
jgi:CRP-like cAMP-binding protein